MKQHGRYWIATALLASGLSAQAEVQSSQPYDLGLNAFATLTFSADLLGTMDTSKISTAPYGWALNPITIQKDLDGFYENVQITTPIQSLTVNGQTALGFRTTGGVTLSAPSIKSVSSGGSITVTDLDVDLQSKTIYARIIGGNGIGQIDHLALWRYSSLTGSTYPGSGSASASATISGLTITTEGYNAFFQSLGLYQLGRAALVGVTDYGSVSIFVDAPLELGPPPPWYVSSTPEPSSYAMMGLGLLGLRVVAQRRRASRSH